VQQRIAETRLADGTTAGYALAGQDPLLVYPPGRLSHLELSLAIPAERRYCETLAHGRTLLRYDKPGTSLSGPLTARSRWISNWRRWAASSRRPD
jgi:hypothetical protein